MYPLLHPGDVVLVDPHSYLNAPVRRGHVVAFKHAAAPSGHMLKLVVGLPGERLTLRNDQLWIDDRELDFGPSVVGSLPGQWILGPNELFVLSSALAVGTDSRSFGPVAADALLGRAWFVLPPSPRAGRLARARITIREP